MFKLFIILIFVLLNNLSTCNANPYYYFKQIATQHGLPSTVNTLFDDNRGTLWIGTNYGIYSFDGEELSVIPGFTENTKLKVHHIQGDTQNQIWIFSDQGVFRYNLINKKLSPITHSGKPLNSSCIYTDKEKNILPIPDSLILFDITTQKKSILPLYGNSPSLHLTKLKHIHDNRYLALTTHHQLVELDISTGNVQLLTFPHNQKIINFYIDSFGRLWISNYGQGVACYNLDYHLIKYFDLNNSDLSHTVILDIEERNGDIWLATDGGGINIIDHSLCQITTITTNQHNNFPANSVNCLHNSKHNMWIGMIREGVLGVRENFITTYTSSFNENKQEGLTNKCILCIHEDENGMLWIGTDGGGIHSYSPDKENIVNYPETYGDKVVSICPYSENELLISCFTKGIFLFNKQTGKCKPFIIHTDTINQQLVQNGYPINIFRNLNGKIEFHGVLKYRYDSSQKKFSSIHLLNEDFNNSWIFCGNYNNKSFFHNQKMIFYHDPMTDSYVRVSNIQRNELILAAAVDSKGTLWISRRSGISFFDLKTQTTNTLNLPNPLDIITALIPDNQGQIWLGSIGKLYSYSTHNNKFIIYSKTDGVGPNDFLAKAVLKARNENIYMGGSMGLVRVNPSLQQNRDAHLPEILLRDLILNGKDAIPEHKGKIPSIEVPHQFNSLIIKVKLKNGDIFRQYPYRFYIKGLHSSFYQTNQPEYVIHSLPSGCYTIMAQCLLSDGTWTSEFSIIQLNVQTPWWLNTWFIFCIIGSLILLSIWFIYRRDEILKRKMHEKEKEIYKEKVQALININHELRTPLTLLYSPLKQVLQSKQLPLELRTKLLGVYKQVRQMRNIINMILNIRQMEVGQHKLNLTPLHFNDWLKTILEDFKNEFTLRSVTLSFCPDSTIEYVSFDSAQCEIIINNLLMNAYKFSNNHTEVSVFTKLSIDKQFITIEIQDQGIGIQEDLEELLFESFQQGDHTIHGTGIGLAYAKQLVEMHGGKIGVYNNTTKGATFYFTLPYTQEQHRISCPAKAYMNEMIPIQEDIPKIEQDNDNLFHSVLIVEDDPDLCEYLAINLQGLFHTVYCAQNGMEALPIISSRFPQLVISDVIMPRMNGFELCQRIKQNETLNYIPVILLTSKVEDEYAEQGYAIGANAWIPKPFDLDMLMIQIQNILLNQNTIRKHYIHKSPTDISLIDDDPNPLNEQFVLKLNHIVQENMDNCDLNVNLIANKMGMSRASLYNKMKEIVGIGVNEYVTQLRIQQACTLLTTTDKVIREIAENTGFSHPRNFSASFKNTIGETPTEYRKRNQHRHMESI